ncbi:MAG: S24 family peptidase [Billgrantia sp.]
MKTERIKLSLSQEELAQLGGVSRRAQASYESGERSPRAEYLEAVALAGVDVGYVLTGQRSVEPSVPAQRVADGAPVEAANVPGQGLAEVKLYDVEGAAGAGRDLESERIEGFIYFPEVQLAALGIQPTQVAGIKVRGDSMESTLADGDWVLVNLANRDIRKEGVFLLTVSGERRIKRVQRLAGGALYLISDNEHYQPEMIKPEQMREVEILGRCEVRIGRIS